MKKLLIMLGLFLIVLVTPSVAMAQTPPSFPSCISPQGDVKAQYSSGTHGIVGSSLSYTGSDTVYTVTEETLLQCFCPAAGTNGVETQWWKLSELSQEEINTLISQGWISVPNGLIWGLSEAPYLARNSAFNCNSTGGGSTGGGGSQGSAGGGTGGSGNPPVCTDSVPGGAPHITSITQVAPNSIRLTWTEAADPVTYYLIAYGTSPGSYQFGNPNIGGKGTTTFTVSGLSAGATYYFVVRAGNGCMPGPFSNEATVAPTGEILGSLAYGFGKGLGGIDTLYDGSTESGEILSGESNVLLDQSKGAVTCGKCIWWPILVLEAAAVLVYFYIMTHNKSKSFRLFVGLTIPVLTYILFLVLNRQTCVGRTGLWWYLKTNYFWCKYFWLWTILTFLGVRWIWKRNFEENPSSVTVKAALPKKSRQRADR